MSDTLAAVLRGSPDWDALPQETPARIVKLIRGCLQRDRKERVPDIAVARMEIREALAAPQHATATASPAGPVTRISAWRRAAPYALTAAATAALVTLLVWGIGPAAAPPHAVTRFAITLPDGQQFTTVNYQSVAISPDGANLTYTVNSQLFLRTMSQLDGRPIPGTFNLPVRSARCFTRRTVDRVFLVYDGAIKKVAKTGGAAVTICAAATPILGMSWSDGSIWFGQSTGLMRVSENSGAPDTIVLRKGPEMLHGPRVLPGGEWLLFTRSASGGPDGWDKATIVARSLKSGEEKVLVTGGSDAWYFPTGHLVYALSGVLFAVPFDASRLVVTGGPVPVIDGVRRSTGTTTGTAHFSVSNSGTIVYVPGPTAAASSQLDLAMVDRAGNIQLLKLTPAAYSTRGCRRTANGSPSTATRDSRQLSGFTI